MDENYAGLRAVESTSYDGRCPDLLVALNGPTVKNTGYVYNEWLLASWNVVGLLFLFTYP
jgi:hypothetical protein